MDIALLVTVAINRHNVTDLVMQLLCPRDEPIDLFPAIYDLVNVFHHDAFHLIHLSFHSGQPAHLLWVIPTVLHLISKPRPVVISISSDDPYK
jgi:hypothetical protein